jgi:pimeloyl-ACP methyl ester carboxylesterase
LAAHLAAAAVRGHEADSGASQRPLRELADRIPRGRFVSLPTSHGGHEERPGEFAAVVMPFLAEAVR